MPRKPTKDRPLRWGHGSVHARTPGIWQARWTDESGRRRAASFPTEEAAYAHLRAVAEQQRTGQYVPPDALLLSTVLRRWLDRHEPTVQPSTAAIYRHEIDRHLIPALGADRVRGLSAARIQHEVDRWLRQGFARATVQKRLTVLRAALDECLQLQILPSNPARYVKLPRPVKPALTVWTAAEAIRVLEAAEAAGPCWAALYRLALATGLRPGELRALRWTDLDLDKHRLVVRRTVTRNRDRREVIGASTKTHRDRAIALPPEVSAALRRWRAAQQVIGIGGWCFTNPRGQVLSSATFAHTHQRLVAAAGVPYIRPHDMRHTAATLLLQAGVHAKIVADLLGHASIVTTIDTYSHVDESMQRAAVDQLAALLRSGERDGS